MSVAFKLSGPQSSADPISEISQAVSEITGVQLGHKQLDMVTSRLFKRSQELGLKNMEEYFKYFRTHREKELESLTSLLTTHHTYFFREIAHFDYVATHVLPGLVETAKKRADKTIRIWSAACSRGQEVYSLAMFLSFHLSRFPDIKFEILGTDVDSESVKMAGNGVYHRNEIKEVPMQYLANHWARGTKEIADYVKAKSSIHSRCRFHVANLIRKEKPNSKNNFDIIFCRNVFIYFTPEQIRIVSEFLLSNLDNNGHLFVGLSESLNNLGLPISVAGPSIYTHKKAVPTAAVETVVVKKPEEPKLLRVMCVDDSPTVLTLLKQILSEKNGFQVVATAVNGLEASKKLNEMPAGSVDVMTLDIHMPEQNGVQYLEKNFNSQHPPVVMVSSVSRDDSAVAVKSLKFGASDYVEKPTLSNMAARGEELQNKLRCSYRMNSSQRVSATVDKAFRKNLVVSKPEQSIRIIVAHLSDRKRLRDVIAEFKGPQPPTHILVDGASNIVVELAKTLSSEWYVQVQTSAVTQKLPIGHFHVSDFQTTFGELKKVYTGLKSSILVLGEPSSRCESEILTWNNAHLIIEDLGSRTPRQLKDAADYVIPLTGFAYHSNEFLSGE